MRSEPCSPAELCCLPAEHEAELVALAIGNDDIFELLHHAGCAKVHQVQSPRVIRLSEVMGVSKSGYSSRKLSLVRVG